MKNGLNSQKKDYCKKKIVWKVFRNNRLKDILKSPLNLIRVTKIDEILNVNANTNKIEQTLEQFLKKWNKIKRLQNLS